VTAPPWALVAVVAAVGLAGWLFALVLYLGFVHGDRV